MATQKKVLVTRQTHRCPIFGLPKELCGTNLPTYEDVLLSCFEESYNISILSDSKKKVAFTTIADSVATQIETVYCKASIPVVTHTRVVQMIKAYHDAYYNLRKSYNRDQEKEWFKNKIKEFVAEAKSKLFDIAACKCDITYSCVCGKKASACDCPVVVECNCEKDKKIPFIERKFMYDQRTTRISCIGSLDKQETKKLKKRKERKQLDLFRETVAVDNDTCDMETTRKSPHKKSEIDLSSVPSTSQMRVKLTSTALVSDRFGVSDRATAAIASSVLHDLEIISEEDMSLVIDKSKIRREKQKTRQSVVRQDMDRPIVTKGIYFDGRKDNTIFQEKIGAKIYRRVRKEEHISVIREPGGQYVGHVTPASGTGSEIAKCTLKYLEDNNIDINELEAIGCDGTATNTGWKNGVIRNIEVTIQRPLQWFICLLHFNELPYRHLFEYLDGVTTGPASFSGKIGKQLPGCEKLPVVHFEAIESDEINVDKTDLSKGQQYLLEIVRAIQTGQCAPDLAVRDPGPISHSRWLTCANRVLRLFISQTSPSNEIKMLVGLHYIVKTYAPVWFDIKRYQSVKYGPKHIFKVVQTTRHLPDDIKNIIDPVIERNAFFCHPENMLLAMIVDERQCIQELGYRRVLKARTQNPKGNSVRTFTTPSINFDATDYIELIDWTKCKLSGRQLTMMENCTTETISSLLQDKALPEFDFLNFPCHTQAVERCVKLVTESAEKVCGQENRDGYIRATLLSRSTMPKFDKKSEFKTTSLTKST